MERAPYMYTNSHTHLSTDWIYLEILRWMINITINSLWRFNSKSFIHQMIFFYSWHIFLNNFIFLWVNARLVEFKLQIINVIFQFHFTFVNILKKMFLFIPGYTYCLETFNPISKNSQYESSQKHEWVWIILSHAFIFV